ncbi:MmcQ/YjbR family DNA-binding protein [Yinghuangia soli]|uniref:MmcQ/YjbR family DNA-binding protein n=1 Tax=Yinghuangia soli TaxID=2908204 RepID=A0AA41U325_9ACTN|nr:MmcQ/YjbR family DNA-binding protein [Yinghuangia soli]MCF2527669.1 MmcQ/YjbR family DNA-binding protein [Yinghuangia soli]
MATTPDDVRREALALPETAEKLAWGAPTFRVRDKIFAALAEDDASVAFRCPKEDRAELIAAEPEKFFMRHGHDDNYNWIRAHLAAVEDADELRAMLTDSWRMTAPKRVVKAFDEAAAEG